LQCSIVINFLGSFINFKASKISDEFEKAQEKLNKLPESQISSDVISAIFADAKNAIANAKNVNSKLELTILLKINYN
jgi:hypothetical protein